MNKTQQYYTDHADHWAANKTNSFFHKEYFRKFISYLKPGSDVLDIGCANGIHVPLFQGIGNEMHYEGFDVSPRFLEIASLRYPQLIFHQGSITDSSALPKKKYDAFWCAAMLMHLDPDDLQIALNNIESLLHAGAYGYVTLPEERFIEGSQGERHFEFYTPNEAIALFEGRGWECVDHGPIKSSANNKWHWYIVRL